MINKAITNIVRFWSFKLNHQRLIKPFYVLQVPMINLAISAFLCALIALFFDLEKLVEFMSIGTLLAYTIVSASVVILRYRPTNRGLVRDSSSLLELPTSQADVRASLNFNWLKIMRLLNYKSFCNSHLKWTWEDV